MPLTETIERLTNSGLDVSIGITAAQDGRALIAKNVEANPDGAIAKRKGFQRAMELAMAGSVILHFQFSDVFLSVDSLGFIDAT